MSSELRVLNKTENIRNSKLETQNSPRTRALLKIQDGCNNFCAYCVVPYLRGREVSLSSDEVIKEAKELEAMGYKELVLSGVNVGKYVCELGGIDLTGLVGMLLAETNFSRIRLSSINPQDITEAMISLWAKNERLCPHFHLSLQSGSNGVLKRMGRPYTREEYMALSNKIVQNVKDAAITTDVIVGFPGETEDEFAETLELIKEVKFAKLHVFRYSKRPGTRAEKMEGQVAPEIIKERSNILLKLDETKEIEYKNEFLGREMSVLFEEKKNGLWQGLTANYLRIGVEAKEDLTNQIRMVRIKEFKEHLLIGEIL